VLKRGHRRRTTRACRRLRDHERRRAAGGASIELPLAECREQGLDLHHYRQRERAERLSAQQATSEDSRKAHLELAESYRSVIEAYERLEALRPVPRSVA
jgi:hypothetical protein